MSNLIKKHFIFDIISRILLYPYFIYTYILLTFAIVFVDELTVGVFDIVPLGIWVHIVFVDVLLILTILLSTQKHIFTTMVVSLHIAICLFLFVCVIGNQRIVVLQALVLDFLILRSAIKNIKDYKINKSLSANNE